MPDLTLYFESSTGITGRLAYAYRLSGWPGDEPPHGSGLAPERRTDPVVAAYAGLWQGLHWLSQTGGLCPGDTLRLETPDAVVVGQLLGRGPAEGHRAVALDQCRKLLKALCQPAAIRPSIHPAPKRTPDAHRPAAEEPPPGKAEPPATDRPAPACRWCGQRAEFRCHYRAGKGAQMCQAPMCRNHRTVMSAGFLGYTDQATGRRKGRTFTAGHCPEHAAAVGKEPGSAPAV